MFPFKYKINLVTMKDIKKFVQTASEINCELLLKDENSFCVSAKSIMGAVAALEWNSLYLHSTEDVFWEFQEFIEP